MQRQTLLIGSLALNAILVVALCSSMLSNNLGSTIRAQQHARVVSPVAMRSGRMATFAQKNNVESMKRDFARTMGAAALGATAALHSAPAQALVDQRLNGDGAGIPLGVNDSRLFFILAGVFTTVWAIYSQSVKGISNNDDDDSGMSLS